MMANSINHHRLTAVLSILLLISIQLNCTKAGMVARTSEPAVTDELEKDRSAPEVWPDTTAGEKYTYDLEEETLEERTIEPEKISDEIEPLRPDTVSVEDVSTDGQPGTDYGIGYRIQVFASGELETAEAFKRKVSGEVNLPVYVEFEGGLYKVRLGDFSEREDAAAVRAKLAELYPDCWIARTTVRK